ncbi:unnamed protein product, partial [Notodromas monacha]
MMTDENKTTYTSPPNHCSHENMAFIRLSSSPRILIRRPSLALSAAFSSKILDPKSFEARLKTKPKALPRAADPDLDEKFEIDTPNKLLNMPRLIPKVTVQEYLWAQNAKLAERSMVVCALTNRSYTYEMIHETSICLAAALRVKMGLERGAKVALVMPNVPEVLFLFHAVLIAGLIILPVNPLKNSKELESDFSVLRPEAIICPNPGFNNMDEVVSKLAKTGREPKMIPMSLNIHMKNTTITPGAGPKTTVLAGPHRRNIPDSAIMTVRDLIEEGYDLELPADCGKIEPEDVAVLPYSSKGYDVAGQDVNAADVCDCIKLERGFGAQLVMMPLFAPDFFVKTITKFRPTILVLFPTLLQVLVKNPLIKPNHLASVKMIATSIERIPKGLMKTFRRKFKRYNIIFKHSYYTVESGIVCSAPNRFVDHFNAASLGGPVANMEIRVWSTRRQQAIAWPNNEFSGRIECRGPQLMKHYWNCERPTDCKYFSGDFFRSDDLGYFSPDGELFLMERFTDKFVLHGSSLISLRVIIKPEKLEAILKTHPKIVDAAILEVFWPDVGFVPRAFLTLKSQKTKDYVTLSQVNSYLSGIINVANPLQGGVQILEKIPRRGDGRQDTAELKRIYYNLSGATGKKQQPKKVGKH